MFYKNKITEKDKENVRIFLKLWNVSVRFTRKSYSSALCCQSSIRIDIKDADTIQILWSCVLHELAHIICYRTFIYEIYHHDSLPEKKYAKYIRRNGLKIEKFIDKKAEKLMEGFFPDIPFIGHYNNKDNQLWYKKWITKTYPL